MNAKHVELLRRLGQFQLDSPEASFPFSARLARENNWSADYARRVINEYMRFTFLAVAAGHPVSPSEDVDQAWHLHLTYSENYWKVFCPEILGQPFHHHPTRGGEGEGDKFHDWYSRTLKSYEDFFNERPPVDIWPSAEARRKEKHDFIRVDRERSWVLPKPHLKFKPAHAVWLALGAATVFGSGAVFSQGIDVFDWRGPDFLLFYIVLFAVCFSVAFWLRNRLRVPVADSRPAPDLDGYSIAYLNGGRILTVNTAIANLVNQAGMRVDSKSRRATSLVTKPMFTHELERLIYAAARSTDGNTISNIRLSAKSAVEPIAETLKERGLVVADAAAKSAILLPLTIALIAIAIGVIKILVGVSRDRPVGFLIVLCVLSLVISLIAFARRPLRSHYGDAVLKQLQERHTGPRTLGRNISNVPAAEFAMVMGLFGMNALVGSQLGDLRQSLMAPTGNGGSCGGGCGGGSCGGGCGGGGGGGCGGCGGGGGH
jgi:uncharacterized protein (TIGR04222 family)